MYSIRTVSGIHMKTSLIHLSFSRHQLYIFCLRIIRTYSSLLMVAITSPQHCWHLLSLEKSIGLLLL